MPRSTKSRSRRQWASSAALLALIAAPAPAHSQPPSTKVASCVDVRVGSARSYDCLNRSLERDVARDRPAADASTLTATSPAPRLGLYNQAGTREHLGANFGMSAVPAARPH